MNRFLSLSRRTQGYLLVLFAGFSLSMAATFIKIGLNDNADPFALLAFRSLVGTFVLWGVFALFQPQKLRIDRQGLWGCFLAGAANTVSLSCFYFALNYIDVSVAIVIFSVYPALTLLLLAFRGEPITRINLIRLGLAVSGVYLLVGPGGDVHPIGILLVMVTVVFFSVHISLIQWRLSKPDYAPQTITVYIVTFMALIMGVVYLSLGKTWPTLSTVGWGVVLWTGVVSTAIARLAMFAGIQRIGSGQTALLGPLEILLAVFWAMVFLGEKLSWIQVFGGVFILSSALLAAIRRPRTIASGQIDT